MSSAGVSLFRIWEERNLSVEERRVLWLRRVRTPVGFFLVWFGWWLVGRGEACVLPRARGLQGIMPTPVSLQS